MTRRRKERRKHLSCVRRMLDYSLDDFFEVRDELGYRASIACIEKRLALVVEPSHKKRVEV